GLGSVGYVAREIIGQEKIVDYTPRPNYLDRFAEKIGVSAASSFRTMFEQLSIK
ncbi:MAG: S49 family peptidase, partial [Gammaproteobacteria bacterium]|nr:S49 family peptidase [Gammaproteobacteria bacterium]